MDSSQERRCSTCDHIKPITDFYKDASMLTGWRVACKACETAKRHARTFRLEPNAICEYDGRPFHQTPSRVKQGKVKYCSKSCLRAAHAIERGTEKCCQRCGVIKPLKEFYKQLGGLYGVNTRCRQCCAKRLSLPIVIDGIDYLPMPIKEWYQLLRTHGLKYCGLCQSVKALEVFSRLHSSLDGRGCRCRECHRKIYARDRLKLLASKKVSYRKNAVAERKKAKTKKARYRIEKPDMLKRQGQRHNARQRAMKSQTLHVDDIELDVLALRDNWICHICKKKVTRKNWSADHLIPISSQGETSYLNIALAHISCNSSRGPGRLPAQLRLFGLPPGLLNATDA